MHFLLLLLIVTSIHVYSASNTTEQSLKGRSQGLPPYTCHVCFGSKCFNPDNKTCDGALECFTHISIIEDKILLQKGCLKVPFIIVALCRNTKVQITQNETIPGTKCCKGNLCNDDQVIEPSTPHPGALSSESGNDRTHTEVLDSTSIIFFGLACIAIFSLLFGTAFVVSRRRTGSDKKKKNFLPKFYSKPSVNDTFVSFLTSGSGSGWPSLTQRTFAQDVTLTRCIGKGRFGEVWQGTKRGENVAVKIFSTRDEASWENEVNIYTNISLSHENVLGFKGSTITSRFDATEMWLLTTFHEQGSLFDYLLENTVTHKQMIEFVRSACSGLLHLHVEMFGLKGKPGIAHRDLKTRNILVTSQGTCVIADFGLAVVKGFETSNIPINCRVGTKRYMAPEILDESINPNSFESFKRADIYAFGLILWEVCSRCVIDGTTEDYRPPYADCVPNNPDFEDMKKVVCIESKRPEIPDRWSSDESLDAMAKLMKLCWHKNPEIRYTACRVLIILDKIRAQIREQSSAQPV